jgi:hypothetical protein
MDRAMRLHFSASGWFPQKRFGYVSVIYLYIGRFKLGDQRLPKGKRKIGAGAATAGVHGGSASGTTDSSGRTCDSTAPSSFAAAAEYSSGNSASAC